MKKIVAAVHVLGSLCRIGSLIIYLIYLHK